IKSLGGGIINNPSTPQPTEEPTTDKQIVIESKKNEAGVAEAVITAELLQKIAASDTSIEISLPSDADSHLVLSLSSEAQAQWSKLNVDAVTITTPLGTIKLNAAIVQGGEAAGSLEVSLENKPAAASIAEATGSSSVLEVKVSRNGESLGNLSGNVTI